MKTAPEDIWIGNDVIIATETMITEKLDIPKYYSRHALATPKARGRPEGGVSCIYKNTIGKVEKIITEENLVILKTPKLTIIGIYISPANKTDDATEQVAKAIAHTRNDENVILAGDLNCRIDKQNSKTDLIMEQLQAEGYCLINKKEKVTYIAPNGTSTIDLIFVRGKDILPTEHHVAGCHKTATLRKHLPVYMNFQMKRSSTQRLTETHPSSRKLDISILKADKERLDTAHRLIEANETEPALNIINKCIRKALTHQKPRKSKAWFDAECYKERKLTLTKLHRARKEKNKRSTQRLRNPKKNYKKLLKIKEAIYSEEHTKAQAQNALKDPFTALKKKIANPTNQISMET